MSKGFRVTVEDLDRDESQTMIVGAGDYILIPFAPCYMNFTQRWESGTVQVTLKDHAPQPVEQSGAEPRVFSSDGPPPPEGVTVLEKAGFDSMGDPGRFIRRSPVHANLWFWATSPDDDSNQRGLFEWPPARGEYREVQS